MNWAAMSFDEVRSYAPLYASTDLERALLRLSEEDRLNDVEREEILDELGSAESDRDAAESALESLKDDIFDIIDNEDGEPAELIKRIRERLDK